MTTIEQFLASLDINAAVEAAERPDVYDGDEVCRSVVEGGRALLQTRGLEAAATFLSGNMFRLLMSRRAALTEPEPMAAGSEAESLAA